MNASVTKPPARRASRWLALLAGVIVYTGSGWLSDDLSSCDGFSMACIAAIFVLFVDGVLICRKFRRARPVLVARVTLLGLVTAATAIASGSAGTEAQRFKDAFGIAPPTGVTGLTVRAQYTGIFDAPYVYLRFKADRDAIDAIVRPRGFRRGEMDEVANEFRAGVIDAKQLWSRVFPDAGDGGSGWRIPTLVDPVVYEVFPSVYGGRIATATLLWDAKTREAYLYETSSDVHLECGLPASTQPASTLPSTGPYNSP